MPVFQSCICRYIWEVDQQFKKRASKQHLRFLLLVKKKNEFVLYVLLIESNTT